MLEVVRYWYEKRKDPKDTEVLALIAALYDFQMKVVTIKNNFMAILEYLSSRDLRFIDLSNEELAKKVFEEGVKTRNKFFHRFDPKMRVLPVLVKAVSNVDIRKIAKRYSYSIELLTKKVLTAIWTSVLKVLGISYSGELITFLKSVKRSCTGDLLSNVKCILPLPDKAITYKRINLFLRWLVRDDYPDLGLWSFVDKSKLIVPLDTGILRVVGRMLGIGDLRRGVKALKIVMNFLRSINPEDPVKYDFILSRPPILGWCKSSIEESSCDICYLRKLCLTGMKWRYVEPSKPKYVSESREHLTAKEVMLKLMTKLFKGHACWTEKVIDHCLRPDVYCENSGVIVGEAKVIGGTAPNKVSDVEGPQQIIRYYNVLANEQRRNVKALVLTYFYKGKKLPEVVLEAIKENLEYAKLNVIKDMQANVILIHVGEGGKVMSITYIK